MEVNLFVGRAGVLSEHAVCACTFRAEAIRRIFLLGHIIVYFFCKSHVNLLQMRGDTIYGAKCYGAHQKHRTKHVVYYISKHSHVNALLATLLWFSEVVREVVKWSLLWFSDHLK